VAAIVVAPRDWTLPGLDDSKKLTPERRERLAEAIRASSVLWAIGRATPAEIDEVNILQATFLAMRRAIAALTSPPASIAVDGNKIIPGVALPQRAIVKGDSKVAVIAAASILAKTDRDAAMLRLHGIHPGYGFDQHMGYPTPVHLEALRRLGPCPEHRLSFAPVRLAAGEKALPGLFQGL
jgi:ribonuclease HII